MMYRDQHTSSLLLKNKVYVVVEVMVFSGIDIMELQREVVGALRAGLIKAKIKQ